MHGQRRGGRAAEPRTPTGKREPDQNRERLIYCVSSLVGHRVTVKLRNNVIFEGLFHSCSLESDYSITLKLARRLPSQDNIVSGEVINTLVIPGKDFLQVSAVDVPAPCELEDESSPLQAGAFTTDSDIAARRSGQAGQERDLVPWNHDGDDAAALGGLDESRGSETWDQFARNESMFGVMSTYRDDLYTTKLDPSAIPRATREQAERIAAEIEREQQSAEVEKNIDCDGDEEDLWSAVQNPPRRKDQMLTGSSTAASSQRGGSRARNSQDQTAMVPQVPLTKEFLSQHDSLQIPAEGFAKEHRAKRSLITAHSPMRSPMVSEMKRINALNLEPALPKLDDKTRNDWINYKQSQTRTNSKPVQGACLKTEFQQSLEAFHKWEATKHSWPQHHQDQGANDHGEGMAPRTSQSGHMVPADGHTGQAGSNAQPATAPASTGGDASAKASRSGSKPFTFNAGAASFTPSGMGSGSQPLTPMNSQAAPAVTPNDSAAAQASPMRKSPSPPLTPFTPQGNAEVVKKTLEQLLNPFLSKATGQKPETQSPQWPQANGPPYKEVLGTASSAPQQMQAGMPQMQGAPGAMPSGPWQPAQGQMVGNAQMAMPQGFVVPGQPQMYAQMYPGGPVPRPQGAQGGGQNQPSQQSGGQSGQSQGQQPSGAQQPGGGQSQGQPPGQHMVFNQMGQQPMQMPGGMVNAQGQNPASGCMGAMAPQGKFGGQPTMVVPMVMPGGNYGPGFAQGGGAACVQPGMMQQHMYTQRPPMPGNQSNMGGGQMPDQMPGHG